MATMALDNGQWFDVADASQWTSNGVSMFYVAGRWALRDLAAAMLDGPAKLIDASAALTWLTCAGFDIPEQLTAIAESSRLRVSS